MPQPKHDRCLVCRWGEFGDLKQKDEVTGEPIGKCCHEAPQVVVVHFQESALTLPGAKNANPGAIHEIVTGAQPVVKASFWCRHWAPWAPVAARPSLPSVAARPSLP